MFDFVRCQRADGTHYGTAGRCQKGREVGPKPLEQMFQRFSAEKKKIFSDLISKTEGISGVHKDLGNGIYVIRGDAGKLDGYGYLPGVPRALASVIGKDGKQAIVARKTVRPWEKLQLPENTLIPRTKDNPMKFWLNVEWGSKADIDMAVNPLLLTADSLLKPAYDAYNREFFENKLPQDTRLFVAPSMRAAVGLAVGYRSTKVPFSIALSWRHLREATEEAIHGVLLHEMVHVHDYQHGRWDEDHGKIFKAKLNKIHKSWKRDSQRIYPDLIITQPDAKQAGSRIGPRLGRQFPSITMTSELLASAQDRNSYIFKKWK